MSTFVIQVGIILESILSIFLALILLGAAHPIGYAIYTIIELAVLFLVITCAPNIFYFIVQVRIIVLLVFTPLALGSVHPISYTTMELMVLFLVILWMVKILRSQVKHIFPHVPAKRQSPETDLRSFSLSHRYLLCTLIILFLGLTYLQMLPLPRAVLKFLSPKTVELYDFALAGINPRSPRETAPPTQMASTISFNPSDTRTEFYKLLIYCAVFFLIACNLRTWKQQRAIYVAIILVGASLAVFGIAQKLAWNGKIYWFWQSKYGGGPFGPYINKNHFAGYMEMAIPLALCSFVLRGSTRRRTRHGIRRKTGEMNHSILNFFIFCPFIVIMTSALCLSLSRGGLLSFSVSMIFLTVLLLRRRSTRGKIWIIPVVLFMVGVTVNWLGSSEILSTWDRTFQRGPNDPSLQQRLHIWSDIIRMWRDFPIFGVGFGAFSSIFTKYSTLHDNIFTAYTESDHFRLFAETGALGVLISASVLAAFFITCAAALRSIRNARRRSFSFRADSGPRSSAKTRERKRTKRRKRNRRENESDQTSSLSHFLFPPSSPGDGNSELAHLLIVGGMTSIVAILAHGWCDFNLFIPANAFLFTVIAALTYTVCTANVMEITASGWD